jgi:hypothetical protein
MSGRLLHPPFTFHWPTSENFYENPQSLHPYTYVHNNPVNWTDPTGRCIPWLDPNCRPFWEEGFGWEDFQQYSAGVVEGLGGIGETVVNLFKEETWIDAGRGLDYLTTDFSGAMDVLDAELLAPIGRGWDVLWNDPAQARRILNENPRAIGQIFGNTVTSALMARQYLQARATSAGRVSTPNPKLSYLEYKALRLQGFTPEEAVSLLRKFRSGVNPGNGFAFHFTSADSASKIIESCMLKVGPRGMRGPGIYAGTTPTPSWPLKHMPAPGWGLFPFTEGYPYAARIPIALRPAMDVHYHWYPYKSLRISLNPGDTLPLIPGE